MSYEIPQQLEYKEKIMFGLTFKQLAYAFLFFGGGLLIIKAVGLNVLGVMLAIFPCLLGIGFVFLNFDSLIKDYFLYYKSRKIMLTEKSLNTFLGIKEIKENYLFNVNGKRIAIFKISPINFSIKHPDEKETVIASFQKFLNALDFPTQLLVNTESIDVEHYLKSVKARSKEKKYEELITQHERHLRKVVNDKKITNRVFHLVVPEKEDIEIQVELCKQRLSALNLKYDLLETRDLEKLISQCIPLKKPEMKKEEMNEESSDKHKK